MKTAIEVSAFTASRAGLWGGHKLHVSCMKQWGRGVQLLKLFHSLWRSTIERTGHASWTAGTIIHRISFAIQPGPTGPEKLTLSEHSIGGNELPSSQRGPACGSTAGGVGAGGGIVGGGVEIGGGFSGGGVETGGGLSGGGVETGGGLSGGGVETGGGLSGGGVETGGGPSGGGVETGGGFCGGGVNGPSMTTGGGKLNERQTTSSSIMHGEKAGISSAFTLETIVFTIQTGPDSNVVPACIRAPISNV
eukprot:scaffold765_cov345-Prasinococcus_capsulatus_cf.AAC.12